uniref:Putative ribonuclease H-like domain-containing protein n=1 Tax=Tanacetum cinerariifolium TaxID=118510 RepID=A0A699GYB9_TANCI|nr:putative ribonuclease H-like domain-containing protein [Tanacetum cinerariifolium]
MESQSESTQTLSFLKLPMLKTGDYDLWNMRMEQYLTYTDYALWEVIVNSDASTAVASASAEGHISPKTAEQKLARKNELKAKSTLLLAIPDENLLKFHGIKDEKSLWRAIKNRFGGNKESKKIQKTIMKQQYENFTASRSEGLDKTYDRFQKLISQLEIHGKVISPEDANLKLLRSLPSAWNNIALIMRNKSDLDTLNNTSSTNEAVNTANDVSDASSQRQASSSTYADDVMFSFFSNQSNSLQLDNEDLEQIDTNDLREMDLKWQVAMLTMRVKRFIKKTRRNLNFNGKETVGFDKTKVECYNCHKRGHFARECRAPRNQRNRNGDNTRKVVPVETSANALVVTDGMGYDWSYQTEEGPTDFALMAHSSSGSSSSSSSDTEVHTYSKECLQSYQTLQKQYDQQREVLNKANLEIITYQLGLDSLEARIVVHEKNKAVYEENIAFLKYDVQVRDISIKDLKNQLENALKEKDDLKLKLENFETSSKNLTKLMNSQISAKDKTGLGYDSYMNENEVIDNVVDSVFESHESDGDDNQVNDRFKKVEGYHAVLPPYTGNFKHARADLFFAGLDDSVYKSKVSETTTSKDSLETTISETSKVPVNNAKQSFPRAAISNSTARNVNIAASRPTVNGAKPSSNVFHRLHSPVRRTLYQIVAPKNSDLKEKVNTAKDQGIFDSGCFRHLIGNKFYLLYYQDIDGVFVAFAGSPKGGKITGKGKIRSRKLDFEDVYFVKKLKFNLFSISQMCDKKNNVLFTETECLVLSLDFKLLDNRVLITKPHNKTSYELLIGRTPNLDFMRPFRCPVTILNTLDHLGKFEGKADEGFLVGYSINSKAFRVFNSRTRKVEENLHIKFLENKSNVAGSGPEWLFDIDSLTKSMNYKPVTTRYQTNDNAGIETNVNAGQAGQEKASGHENILLPFMLSNSPLSSSTQSSNDKDADEVPGKGDDGTNKVKWNLNVNTASPIPSDGIFDDAYDDRKVGAEADTNNLELSTVMDVKSAFLYGTIEEEVYVCQPPGFEDPQFPDKVYKVEKALYVLHQAPRAWYKTLSTYLLENRFRRGTIDKTLFIKNDRDDVQKIPDEFNEELTFFLGLQVKQKDDGILISQYKYVAHILKKFDFVTMKSASTPIKTNKALIKDKEAEDVTPKVLHLHAVKRIFRYLKDQPKLGLWYPRDSPFDSKAFSNSDYAGASLDRKSTTGGCQFLGKRLISWQCKKQTIIANSTTEAEYVAAANCYRQVLWIQNQMLDYGFNFMNTKIHINNESTICIVRNPVFHSKTKYIEIRHHFIRDSYEKKLIQMIKIHTNQNVTDLLTKAFDVSRKAKRTTKISQSSEPIYLVAVETVYKDWKDRMKRAATTASNLEAEQDSGNINRTQSMATLNEPLPKETGLASGPRKMLLSSHKRTYITPTLTPKLFSNMRRITKGYSGEETPLFPTMLVIDQLGQGEGPTIPAGFQHTPLMAPSIKTHTSPSQITEPPTSSTIRETIRQEVETPQSNFPIQTLVADEDAFTSVDVVHGGAATTVSSIDVDSLETELKQTKQTYGAAFTKLIKRVKKLEQTDKTNQARRRAKIMVSDDEEEDEDTSKHGRSLIEEMDLDARISLVPLQVLTVAPEVTTADAELNTASTFISTASPQRHADTTADDLTLAETLIEIKKVLLKLRVKPLCKTNPPVTNVDLDDVQAHIQADEDLAQRMQEEERESISIAERARLLAELIDKRKKLQAAQRYKAIRTKPKTKSQQKRPCQEVLKEPAKRQKIKEASGSVEEAYVEALQVKYPIIDWEVYSKDTRRDDLVKLWDLVKERFSTTEPTDDKENALWVELRRLFEPDNDDTLWKLQSTSSISVGTIPLFSLVLLFISYLRTSTLTSGLSRAFETLENSSDLEPSLNKLDELLTPPFIIHHPNPTLHARIVLE